MTAASVAADTHMRPSEEIIYETPKREPVRDFDDDYDDAFLEEGAKKSRRENVGFVSSPHLMPYVYKRQYGMRMDGDIFKIGDSAVLVDQDGDITIKEKEFWGFEGLWDLLTYKRVNKEHVTSDDLRT